MHLFNPVTTVYSNLEELVAVLVFICPLLYSSKPKGPLHKGCHLWNIWWLHSLHRHWGISEICAVIRTCFGQDETLEKQHMKVPCSSDDDARPLVWIPIVVVGQGNPSQWTSWSGWGKILCGPWMMAEIKKVETLRKNDIMKQGDSSASLEELRWDSEWQGRTVFLLDCEKHWRLSRS